MLWGQQIEVTGHILDTQGISVPYASVIFKTKTADSTIVGVLGGEDGKFKIYLNKGLYNMEVSVVGL